MILSEKLKFIASAVIAVLVLMAALPAGVAAAATTTIFEDDFETGTIDGAKWTQVGSPTITNSDPYVCQGIYAVLLDGGPDPDDMITSVNISTVCMIDIVLSYDRMTDSLEWNDNNYLWCEYSTNGGSTWTIVEQLANDTGCATHSENLPPAAEDIPNLRIRFRVAGGAANDIAAVDNISVTGIVAEPALEVNKTVWNGTAWVKTHTAKINDTLTFKSTITNTGNVNLTYIRFWDILDCSLKYQGLSLKIDNESTRFCDPWMFRFKPRVLHPDEPWCLDDPVQTWFTELCPPCGRQRQIVDWDDTNHDGNVSVCDQIELDESGVYESESERLGLDVNFDDSGTWYHVDRVPYTLNLSENCGENRYFDSVLNWNDPGINLSDPINSTWLEVCCCKDRYTLIGWECKNCPASGISPGDFVTLRNERTQEEITGEVDTDVVIDLVVSIEYEMDRDLDNYVLGDPLASILELFILEPNKTITIEYNATVVKCGVDNNTFVAKGIGCGDNWTYSDPAVVTITVPCPSGDAADVTPVIKNLFTAGEDVYALAHNFAPNKNVSIYITPVRTWAFGDVIATYALFGPVNTTTDANGSIGINPKVLVWPNSEPGLYHMVFDDPDGIYEPGVDLYDLFEVSGRAVPLITLPGIVALIGLLSVIATSTLIRRKKR